MVRISKLIKTYFSILIITIMTIIVILFLKGTFILRGSLQNSIEKKFSIGIKIESVLEKDNMLFVLFTTKKQNINIAAFKEHFGGSIISSVGTTINRENKNIYFNEYNYSSFRKENYYYYIVYGYNGDRALSSYEILFNNGKITKDISNDYYFINEYHSAFKDIPRPDTFNTIQKSK